MEKYHFKIFVSFLWQFTFQRMLSVMEAYDNLKKAKLLD